MHRERQDTNKLLALALSMMQGLAVRVEPITPPIQNEVILEPETDESLADTQPIEALVLDQPIEAIETVESTPIPDIVPVKKRGRKKKGESEPLIPVVIEPIPIAPVSVEEPRKPRAKTLQQRTEAFAYIKEHKLLEEVQNKKLSVDKLHKALPDGLISKPLLIKLVQDIRNGEA